MYEFFGVKKKKRISLNEIEKSRSNKISIKAKTISLKKINSVYSRSKFYLDFSQHLFWVRRQNFSRYQTTYIHNQNLIIYL